MTLRKRITLVAVGLIIFSITAPVILIFARGYRWDGENRRFIQTGSMIVRTIPRNAEVFLNGKSMKTTPLTKRLILPGEYLVEIVKDGYHVWKKNVTVHSQLVTGIPQSETRRLYLLLSNPQSQNMSTGTVDFLGWGDNLLVLEKQPSGGSDLWQITNINNRLESETIFQFESPLSAPSLLARKNSAFIIKDEDKGLFINSAPDLITLPNFTSAQFSSRQNGIYLLDLNNSLVLLNPYENLEQTILSSVADFTVISDNVYFLNNGETPYLGRYDETHQTETVLTNLPRFAQGKIIASPSRQLFLILDRELYQVSDELKKINSRVEYALWHENAQSLLYGNQNEFWLFRPAAVESNRLLTRSSENLTQPTLHADIGYLIYQEGRQIKAMEISGRGTPNVYTLTEVCCENQKIWINPIGDHIAILEKNRLTLVKIR